MKIGIIGAMAQEVEFMKAKLITKMSHYYNRVLGKLLRRLGQHYY